MMAPARQLRYLSLFTGIGGMDLGLDRAGMTCCGQVEIDPYCRAVLARHWPDVRRMEDVRDVTAESFDRPDLICGGFPCQDISVAGKGAGLAGARSGLWYEMLRVIRASRPRWVLAENVPALRTRGADAVLADLERAGYTCWSVVVGAEHVGAPHRRHRVFIVGRLVHAERARLEGHGADAGQPEGCEPGSAGPSGGWRWPARPGEPQHDWEAPRLVIADSRRRSRPDGRRIELDEGGEEARIVPGPRNGYPQPRVGDGPDGLPRRVAGFARRNALRALGNAVVPQVAEVIGRAILRADGCRLMAERLQPQEAAA